MQRDMMESELSTRAALDQITGALPNDIGMSQRALVSLDIGIASERFGQDWRGRLIRFRTEKDNITFLKVSVSTTRRDGWSLRMMDAGRNIPVNGLPAAVVKHLDRDTTELLVSGHCTDAGNLRVADQARYIPREGWISRCWLAVLQLKLICFLL